MSLDPVRFAMWNNSFKPRLSSVPELDQILIQTPLAGETFCKVTGKYWWGGRYHLVTVEVADIAAFPITLAEGLSNDFEKRYPEDFQRAYGNVMRVLNDE